MCIKCRDKQNIAGRKYSEIHHGSENKVIWLFTWTELKELKKKTYQMEARVWRRPTARFIPSSDGCEEDGIEGVEKCVKTGINGTKFHIGKCIHQFVKDITEGSHQTDP